MNKAAEALLTLEFDWGGTTFHDNGMITDESGAVVFPPHGMTDEEWDAAQYELSLKG